MNIMAEAKLASTYHVGVIIFILLLLLSYNNKWSQDKKNLQ